MLGACNIAWVEHAHWQVFELLIEFKFVPEWRIDFPLWAFIGPP